jgi:plastocyanin
VTRRLRRTIAGCAAALALGAGGFALAGTTSLSLTHAGPQPSRVTVPWGGTLAIVNADTVPHTVTSPHPELRSGTLQPGQAFNAVFAGAAHTYGYRQTGGRGYAGVVVVDFTGSVTVRATPKTVPFGKDVKLSGTTSIPNTQVALSLRRVGDKKWEPFANIASDASGAFSTTFQLDRGARVRATVAAGQILSRAIIVNVRPLLAVGLSKRAIRARLTPAAAGKRLTLECRSAKKHWARIGAKRVGRNGVVTFVRHRRKRAARVTLAHRDVASGYSVVSSRVLRAAC